jgi:hypothetical protein
MARTSQAGSCSRPRSVQNLVLASPGGCHDQRGAGIVGQRPRGPHSQQDGVREAGDSLDGAAQERRLLVPVRETAGMNGREKQHERPRLAVGRKVRPRLHTPPGMLLTQVGSRHACNLRVHPIVQLRDAGLERQPGGMY